MNKRPPGPRPAGATTAREAAPDMSQEEVGPDEDDRNVDDEGDGELDARKARLRDSFEQGRAERRTAAIARAVSRELALRREFPRGPFEAQRMMVEGYVRVEDSARQLVRNEDVVEKADSYEFPLTADDSRLHYLIASFLREATERPAELRDVLTDVAEVIRKGRDPEKASWGPSIPRDGAAHPYIGLARQLHRELLVAASHGTSAAVEMFIAEADGRTPRALDTFRREPATRIQVARYIHARLSGELKATHRSDDEEVVAIYQAMPVKPGGRATDRDGQMHNDPFAATCAGGASKLKLGKLAEGTIRGAFKAVLGLDTNTAKNLFPSR